MRARFRAAVAVTGLTLAAGVAHAADTPRSQTHPIDSLDRTHLVEEPGAPGHQDAHGAHDDHAPTFADINWAHGFLGEKEGVEPGLLWRAPGEPAPLLALLLNVGIFYWLLYRFGMPRIREGLKRRRESLMQGMDEAARMKSEAADRLADYEQKLANIDSEIERVKDEMREVGKAEQARVLAEARERRERMERDAHLLVEHELKAASESLYAETVRAAVAAATVELEKRLTAADQQRIAADYLDSIQDSARRTGGHA